MKVVMEPFKYLGTLVEKVKLLVWEITKKNESLASAQTYFSKVVTSLDKANWSLSLAQER